MRPSPAWPPSLALVLAVASDALAQDVPAAPSPPPAPSRVEVVKPTDPRAGWIEEIIITAERRKILAQEFGGSISAFPEEALDARNIQEIQDLQYSVPSLVATGGVAQLTLRGIGNDFLSPGIDPGFGVHVNGVYTNPGTAMLDYFDLERIEVLPGPQGSLGGRNTTGGSIYLWSNRPTELWELEADVELASYGKVRTRVVANVPLGETLAVRVAALFEHPPMPFDPAPNHQRFTMNDSDGGTALRVSARWAPNERLHFDLIGHYLSNPSAGATWRYVGDWPAYPTGQSPLFGASPDYSGASPNPSKALRLGNDRPTRDQVWEGSAVQLIAEWQLGPVVAKATSHFLEGSFRSDFDGDASDLDIERARVDITGNTYTQEVTLESAGDARWQWLIGGNWQREKPNRTILDWWKFQQAPAAANFFVLDVVTFAPAEICGATGSAPCTFTPLPDDFAWLRLDGDIRTDVAAAFATLSVDLTQRLRLVGGARYSYTHRDFRDHSAADVFLESLDIVNDDFCLAAIGVALPAQGCFDALFGTPSGGALTVTNVAFLAPLRGDRIISTGNTTPIALDRVWESVTGNLRLEYTPREDALLYASFAKGERAGGFNWIEGYLGSRGFGPETNLAYEVGVKATLADRLSLSAAAYYYDYQGKFGTRLSQGVQFTTNGGDTAIYGAEGQFVWAASEALRLRGSIGWLHARYTSDDFAHDDSLGPDNPTGFDASLPPGSQHGVSRPAENLKGNPLTRSPDWTLALGGDYRFDLGARGTLTARLDFAWRDELYFRQWKNPLDRQEAYTRTDLSLRWDQGEEGAWAEMYVNNLEDRRWVGAGLSNENEHREWNLAAPRMVGFRAGWTWRSEVSPLARMSAESD